MTVPGKSGAPYAALVFDLGGVIVPHDNEVLYRRLAGRCSARPSAEAIAAAARDPRYERGELPISHLYERLERESGYAGDFADFAADWCSHLGLDPAMLDYVERLAVRRRTLIFSNTNREHWEHLVRMSGGRLGRIEAHLSYEIGDAKPSVSSFLLVARRAGIVPARCFFVDDKPENVAAARQAGFDALVFTSQASLEEALTGR